MSKNLLFGLMGAGIKHPVTRVTSSYVQKRHFWGQDSGFGHTRNIMAILERKEKEKQDAQRHMAHKEGNNEQPDIHPDRKNDTKEKVKICFFDAPPKEGVFIETILNRGVQLKILDLEIPEMPSLGNAELVKHLEQSSLLEGRFSVYPKQRVITASTTQLEHIDAANFFELDVLESARGYFRMHGSIGAVLQNISCEEYYPRPRVDTRVADMTPHMALLHQAGFSQMRVIQYQKGAGAVYSTLEKELEKILKSHRAQVLLTEGSGVSPSL